jgi:hypothetical protein
MSEVEKLQANVEHFRTLLAEVQAQLFQAEEELATAIERSRNPAVGDFARSTLTNFYGCVTRVIPREGGRPWVEITPYLTANLPGKSTMDLYDQWELIEKPVAAAPGTDEPSSITIVSNIAELLRSPHEPGEGTDLTVQIERTAASRTEKGLGAMGLVPATAVAALVDRKMRLRRERE